MHPQLPRILNIEASTSRYNTHDVEANSHPIFEISGHASEEDVGEQRDSDIQSSVDCPIAEIDVAFQLSRNGVNANTGNVFGIEICAYDQSDTVNVELDVKVETRGGFGLTKHRAPTDREDVDPLHGFIVMGWKPILQT